MIYFLFLFLFSTYEQICYSVFVRRDHTDIYAHLDVKKGNRFENVLREVIEHFMSDFFFLSLKRAQVVQKKEHNNNNNNKQINDLVLKSTCHTHTHTH